jgi:hypothetical protein
MWDNWLILPFVELILFKMVIAPPTSNKFPLMVKPFPQVASEPWWAPPLRAPAADASRRRTSSDRGGRRVGGHRTVGEDVFWGKNQLEIWHKNHGNVGKTMKNMEKSFEMWEKSSEN